MKVLVLGGTGATGQLVVDQALAAGHWVRALVRSPEKLSGRAGSLEVVAGQATDPHDVGEAMSGVDAVISTLGATKGSVMTDATRAILAGAAVSGVRRIVVLSSFLVVRDRLSGPAGFMSKLAMDEMVRDKAAAEELLRASGLEWTIAHAVRLSNGRATGRATALPDSATLRARSTITRTDVAAWLLAALDDRATFARAVAIAG
ncbi:NAD(P)-binding oxidoreductase [Amycolatopsis rhabdoformis]|uniref:NAD(P)-binding oxidoreductase n=1 Tax=Amycolatopsis rhabdoformis TaxID=1448059 RepID=A0ABZ1IEF7_9PSEU|nr:NAD(P)-binding oxidoreductase [Amycolatopsis rhabdoformis]WSE32469.1 NAD(P)-binding oxidoreductase [Amycolatopsis rhabdoformis]